MKNDFYCCRHYISISQQQTTGVAETVPAAHFSSHCVLDGRSDFSLMQKATQLGTPEVTSAMQQMQTLESRLGKARSS